MFGNLTYDHNWEALFFLGCGFILAEVLAAKQSMAATPAEELQLGPPLVATAA